MPLSAGHSANRISPRGVKGLSLSAMMGELDPDSRACEAWHAKTDAMWSVVPADLNSLARDLAQCAREVDAFGAAWEERADRDGWPLLDVPG